MNATKKSRKHARRERGQARIGLLALLAGMVVAIGLGTSIARYASADPASPIEVTKTATPNPVASGDQLTYTIAIRNTGGSKLTNMVMTDQVNGVGVIQAPPALPQLQITSSLGTCTQGGANGNVVTCNGGTLPGGGMWVVTIRGQVTAANETTLNNTASVTGTRSAQTFSTSATVQVLVQGGTGGGNLPDLTINKTGPTSVPTSSAMAYTLTVNNIGTAAATNVKVVDTVPAGVTGITAAGTSLFVCGVVGQTVTCDGGAVNAGANATITINGTSPAVEGTITNTAVVDPDNTIAESFELNNTSAQVNTAVGLPPSAPLLDVQKTDGNPALPGTWWTGAGPDPVVPGQEIVYKIQVTNNATGTNSRADDVIVTDGTQGLEASSILATQVVVGGVVGKGNGCVVNAPQVVCKIRSLDSLGTLTITIRGRVISSAGATIFNTATVTGNIKNTGVTDTSSEETTVKPAVDLTITKADGPDPVCARSWPIDGIPFPPGPPGSQHLPLSADAPPAAGSPTELLAPPVCLGGLTYSFVVGNSGIETATDVVVRDPLPPGLIFDTYDTDAGFVCAVGAGNVVTCSGGTIPPESIRNLSFLLVAPPTLGSITNTVYVDPNNAIFEPDETNNTFVQTTQVVTGVDLVTWKSDCVQPDPPGDDAEGAPTLVCGDGVGADGLGDGFDPIATRGTQTYTVYVDNVGTQDTTGIRLRDTLPADTVFLSVVPDPLHGFTCAHNGAATGGVIECTGGHLRGTESEFYDPAGAPPAGPGDDFATIKIRVFARATVGTMHNEVRVDPLNEIAEVNELNNIATDDTLVTVGDNDKGAYHQLKVTKTHVSPANGQVAQNGTLIYNLHIENLGTDPVSNIVLKDTLPAGTRFLEAKDTDTGTDAFFCSHDGSAFGGVVTCTGGDLDGSINTIPVGGTSRDVRIKVFAPNVPGGYTNLATVDPDNLVPEGNEFDNDAQLNTNVSPCTSQADCTAKNAFNELTITKEQNRPTIARNGVETYTLTIENLGSDPVSDIVVWDTLPQGSRFIDARDSAPPPDADAFECADPDASGLLVCTGGDLDGQIGDILGPGVPTSRQIIIRVFMPDEPGTYPNQAQVDPLNAVPEGNEFNNLTALTTDVQNGGPFPYIDLTVDKNQTPVDDQDDPGDGTVRVEPGGGIFYTLLVSNSGEGDAFNVTVRDVLPFNTTYHSALDTGAAPGNFSCGLVPGETHTLECTGGTIPAGGSRNINVFLTAPTNLDQTATDLGNILQLITNSAFVDPANATPEGNESNNVDVVRTTVQSQINLKVESKEGPEQAEQNSETDYTIVVKNEKTWGNGSIAVDAEIVDFLPVGLIPLSVATDASNVGCSIFENPVNQVRCVGDIEPEQMVTITVHVFITADGGTLDNEACIDPGHLIDETNELDNCKTETTNVGSPSPTPVPDAPNLIINKSASTSSVTPGESFEYTIVVSNVGTGPTTTDTLISDTLPTEVTFVSALANNGFECIEIAGTVTCDDILSQARIAAGASVTVTIEVTVNAGVTQSFDNTATTSDPADGSEFDTVTTNVGGSAIDIILANVEDSPDPVAAGSVVQYTIVVSNGGTSDANGLDITQVFDDLTGMTFETAVGSQGFTCVFNATDTVTCSGNLLAGQTTVLTVRFDTTAAAAPSVSSTITADSSAEFAESDETNNTDIEVTTISTDICQNCIDLVLGPVLINPNPVANNATATVNFDVTNVGDLPTSADPDPGTDEVVIEVNIDSIFNEYSAIPSVNIPGFSCVTTSHAGDFGNGAPEITCTKAAGLAAGEGTLASIEVTADTAADPSFVGLDIVVDPGDLVSEFNEFNNTAFTQIDVDTPPPGP